MWRRPFFGRQACKRASFVILPVGLLTQVFGKRAGLVICGPFCVPVVLPLDSFGRASDRLANKASSSVLHAYLLNPKELAMRVSVCRWHRLVSARFVRKESCTVGSPRCARTPSYTPATILRFLSVDGAPRVGDERTVPV